MGSGIKLLGQKVKLKVKKARAQCTLMMEKVMLGDIPKTKPFLLLPSTPNSPMKVLVRKDQDCLIIQPFKVSTTGRGKPPSIGKDMLV